MLGWSPRCARAALCLLLLTAGLHSIEAEASAVSRTAALKRRGQLKRQRKAARVNRARLHPAARVARLAAAWSPEARRQLRRNMRGVGYLYNKTRKTRGTAIMVTGMTAVTRKALFLTSAHLLGSGERGQIRIGKDRHQIQRIVCQSGALDYALVEVEIAPGARTPARIELDDRAPAEQSIYALGYPALAKLDLAPEQLRTITTARPQKRMMTFQQGLWPTAAEPAEPEVSQALEGSVPHHRGMSGGAYFSAETHRAVALHARGLKKDVTAKTAGKERGWTSYAVPMSAILADLRAQLSGGGDPAIRRLLDRYPNPGAGPP